MESHSSGCIDLVSFFIVKCSLEANYDIRYCNAVWKYHYCNGLIGTEPLYHYSKYRVVRNVYHGEQTVQKCLHVAYKSPKDEELALSGEVTRRGLISLLLSDWAIDTQFEGLFTVWRSDFFERVWRMRRRMTTIDGDFEVLFFFWAWTLSVFVLLLVHELLN